MSDVFESEFCHVENLVTPPVVLLTWKQYAHHDDYRKPTLFALEKLRESGAPTFIVDARNGFEDHPDDVEWAFAELLPSMAATRLKHVIFVMNEVSEIEGEMDMWTREFLRYFTVDRATDIPSALAIVQARGR